MRIMAIDYGDVRTGVALSDLLCKMAGQTLVINENKPDKLVIRLTELAAQHDVGRIVLGHPLNMDGTHGERALKSQALAERLRKALNLPVILWDERRTSVDAHRILHASGKHGLKNKQMVDAVASALILEAYLPSMANE